MVSIWLTWLDTCMELKVLVLRLLHHYFHSTQSFLLFLFFCYCYFKCFIVAHFLDTLGGLQIQKQLKIYNTTSSMDCNNYKNNKSNQPNQGPHIHIHPLAWHQGQVLRHFLEPQGRRHCFCISGGCFFRGLGPQQRWHVSLVQDTLNMTPEKTAWDHIQWALLNTLELPNIVLTLTSTDKTFLKMSFDTGKVIWYSTDIKNLL